MNEVVETGQMAGSARAVPVQGGSYFVLTLHPQPGESVSAVMARLVRELGARAAEPLHVLAFGALPPAAEAARALAEALGDRRCPLTWVEGTACDGGALAGVQVFATAGAPVRRIWQGDRVLACVFADGLARHCVVGGLTPPAGASTRAVAAQRTFELLDQALRQAGFGLGEVVRTWFFLDDLLGWYETFNRVRAETYQRTCFAAGCLPASTGVAARNSAGAPLCAAAWAVKPLKELTRLVAEVPSPMQGPARAYGSWFSRAIELRGGSGPEAATSGQRHLWISGTASIARDGRTLYPGQTAAQIEHTLRVVEAILESRGYGLGEVTRAVAYFKSPSGAAEFERWLERRELRRLPVVRTVCGICRDELEFEIELDAAR